LSTKRHQATYTRDWNITINMHDCAVLVGTNVPNNCLQLVMVYMYYCCVVCQMQHNMSFYNKIVHTANLTKNVSC